MAGMSNSGIIFFSGGGATYTSDISVLYSIGNIFVMKCDHKHSFEQPILKFWYQQDYH